MPTGATDSNISTEEEYTACVASSKRPKRPKIHAFWLETLLFRVKTHVSDEVWMEGRISTAAMAAIEKSLDCASLDTNRWKTV